VSHTVENKAVLVGHRFPAKILGDFAVSRSRVIAPLQLASDISHLSTYVAAPPAPPRTGWFCQPPVEKAETEQLQRYSLRLFLHEIQQWRKERLQAGQYSCHPKLELAESMINRIAP
jgi:hypothetical protein